jgi:hypothetical protein
LVLQGASEVNHHLVSHAHARFIQGRLRRYSSRYGGRLFYFLQLVKLLSYAPHLGIWREAKRDEMAEVWDFDLSSLCDCLSCLRTLGRRLKRRVGLAKPVLTKNAVQRSHFGIG